MLASVVLSLLLGVNAVLAFPGGAQGDYPAPVQRCGTQVGYQKVLANEEAFQANQYSIESLWPGSRHRPIDCTKGATIPLHWHVVYENKTTMGGYISDKSIRHSVEVLNDAFSVARLKFKLVNITRLQEFHYFNDMCPGTQAERDAKEQLRVGGVNTLNVYSAGLTIHRFEALGLVGYSTFPENYDTNPSLDGVVIKHTTIPGGSHPEFNMGKTLVHEVGHWVGLHHPFEDGCDGGDMVDDTPAAQLENGFSGGCPKNLDSCTGRKYPGKDPIHNFMSNTNDKCINEFTPGQVKRLREQIRYYRNIRV